jgi:hypothetical protein
MDNPEVKQSPPNPTIPDEKIRKEEAKSNSFDNDFKKLINQARGTILSRYGSEMGNMRDEIILMDKYIKIAYGSTRPRDHYQYFETLYNRKRIFIIDCLKESSDHDGKKMMVIDFDWIKGGNCVIQFGEGIKAPNKEFEEQRAQLQIRLSDIFASALELQKMTLERLKGFDSAMVQEAGGQDLIRPEILMLHLMRIFYHLNDGIDKNQLGKIVTHLEETLGVPMRTVTKNPVDIGTQTMSGPEGTGALSGLFSMATNMMKNMGYEPPAGMKPPSEQDISRVINSVFNNQTTQTAIQGMFKSIQGKADFGSTVQEVIRGVSSPETLNAIQESVTQTTGLPPFQNPLIPQDQQIPLMPQQNFQSPLMPQPNHQPSNTQ